jgi:pimeloyl-ACP methyl ester carboxylesterase
VRSPTVRAPHAIDLLDDGDRAALRLLPADPAAAARGFAAGFESLFELFATGTDHQIVQSFDPMLSARDTELLQDEATSRAFARSMRAAVAGGSTQGGGWDNVSWVGPWDIDLDAVSCPVLLWYGDQDKLAPVNHGRCLRGHLRNPVLTEREGEGHFGIVEHLAEMLAELVGR